MPKLTDKRAWSVKQAKSVTTTASSVKPRRVRWLWKGRLALGYMSLWTGESSLGKSTFFAWLAAQLTHGKLEGQVGSVDVLVIASEDARADTWVPRLMAAGADLNHVHFLDSPPDWNIRDGIEFVEQAFAQHEDEIYGGIRLVFIDSIFEETPSTKGGESIYSVDFIRRALRPFNDLCKEKKVAGLISTHPPKAKGSSFADMVMASAAFIQVTRVGLLFTWHPDDLDVPDQERRRVLMRPPGGSNIGRDPGSYEFTIGIKLLDIEGEPEEVPYITNPEPSDVTFRDVTAEPKKDKAISKIAQVRALVEARLSDGKWHPSMAPELETLGFDKTTISRGAMTATKHQTADKRKWWAKAGTPKGSFEGQLVLKEGAE